ncbi:MAG TPA: TetR/AcrR family transcriptional regulator [Gammaproteobacteria bacterium]|nr:TetR/AcrR family transcriptional regulator [Gammaproteobacteria bacterium]
MARMETRKTRTGARVPKDGAGPSYLGQAIEEGVIVARQEPNVGEMQGRILLAAIALFAERGYENCGTRAIASAVGLKAPTIYNYFPSKEALLVEAIEFGMNDFFSYVLHDIDQFAPEEQFFEIAKRHIVYKIQHRVIARANDKLIDPQFGKMFLPEESQVRFKARLDEYRYKIHELVAKLVDQEGPIDSMIATLSVMNQWDRAAYWYNPAGPRTAGEVVDQMLILTKRILGLSDSFTPGANESSASNNLAAERILSI